MHKETLPLSKPWPLCGHRNVATRLQAALRPNLRTGAPNSLSHAYLLTGARRVGKTTLATLFLQALLCEGDDELSRPCTECRACRLVTSGNHPDFRLFQPLDRDGNPDRANGMLRVEQANELIRACALRPMDGRNKVLIVQDIHRANDGFANKILKTVEEPPDYVVICITADDKSGVLPTIVSRCQPLSLRAVSAANIEQALLARGADDAQQAKLLSRLADGRPGWAFNRLSEPKVWDERQEQLSTLKDLIYSSRGERLRFAEKLAGQRNEEKLFTILELWTTWWRDVMLAQSDCLAACSNLDEQETIAAQAQRLSQSAVRQYLGTLKRIEGYLHHTTNTRLALDTLVLRLPTVS